MTNPTPAIDFLQTICAIDSRTTDAPQGTVKVAQLFAERFAELGFEHQWSDPGPDEQPRGRHLIATRNPGATNRLIFIGHTDTVLSPQQAPLKFDPGADCCFGAGVNDMKGGCVVMLEAVRVALDQHQAVRNAELVVLLNCAEEIGSPSFATLARERAHGATACLGFEPWRLDDQGTPACVDHRKGVVRFILNCRGRAAHAGSNHAHGISAVRELTRKIEAMEQLTDEDRDITVNSGRGEGGLAVNQVPDTARAWIDIRAFDPAHLNETITRVRQLCAEPSVTSRADGATTTLELTDQPGFPAWPVMPATKPLAQRVLTLAQSHGLDATTVGSGGGADASHVADLAPTLDGLGIFGGDAHQPGEWADLATLPQRIAIAGELIADLCHRKVY